MNSNEIQKVLSDEVFVKSLMEMETTAEVQKALKLKGLDLSEKDILKIRDDVQKHLENGTKPDELSLDQLDDVAGGSLIMLSATALVVTLVACAAGGAGAATVFSRLRW